MGGFSAVWCVGLVVGSAMAQVAPPPPGAPAPKPEYVRPEFKPVVPAAIKPTRARPDMTQVEYDSLVVVGDNGKVVRIGRPVALASLKNNPLLGPEQWEALEPWLVQRREKMELLVIDLQIDGTGQDEARHFRVCFCGCLTSDCTGGKSTEYHLNITAQGW